MSNALSIFNQLRPVTVGYDNVFDHFEKMFEDNFFNSPSVNYPPYNIVKTGENTYDIEVALAGYNKKDISIEFAESLLTLSLLKKIILKLKMRMEMLYIKVFLKDSLAKLLR